MELFINHEIIATNVHKEGTNVIVGEVLEIVLAILRLTLMSAASALQLGEIWIYP